jgi:hypothetical protein
MTFIRRFHGRVTFCLLSRLSRTRHHFTVLVIQRQKLDSFAVLAKICKLEARPSGHCQTRKLNLKRPFPLKGEDISHTQEMRLHVHNLYCEDVIYWNIRLTCVMRCRIPPDPNSHWPKIRKCIRPWLESRHQTQIICLKYNAKKSATLKSKILVFPYPNFTPWASLVTQMPFRPSL